MSAPENFYVKVYKPMAVYEYDIEVHPDLIGLDDETQTNNSPKTEANRIALQKAKRGEDEQTDVSNEMIALNWDDVGVLSIFALDNGKQDIAELRELLLEHAPEAEAVFNKLKEMENGSRFIKTSQSSKDRYSRHDSVQKDEGNSSGGIRQSEREERKSDTGQRATSRNSRTRRVAPIQRRRNSRST